jgi:hypothetical protein
MSPLTRTTNPRNQVAINYLELLGAKILEELHPGENSRVNAFLKAVDSLAA